MLLSRRFLRVGCGAVLSMVTVDDAVIIGPSTEDFD